MKINVTLNAGSFAYENETIKVTGNLNVDGKNINNINGQVMSGELSLGSFDAWKNGEDLQFNLHPTSIAVASQMAEAVGAAVEAVKGKL